jgi:YhcH/YjgK/YiaL family protein
MIKDKIENSELYLNAHPLFTKAFEWLKEFGATAPDGKVFIEGEDLVAIPQHYTTHPYTPDKYETHKRYIDIQVVLGGEELVYLGEPSQMTVNIPFDVEKDIDFRTGFGEATTLKAGEFMVIYPHEGHEPGVSTAAGDTPVHKIIFKVAVSRLK